MFEISVSNLTVAWITLLILLVFGLASGCGVEGDEPHDGDTVCRAVLTLTTDLNGNACWGGETPDPGRCCPEDFEYVGVDGTAVVCVEVW